jgi:sugar/nucleoside kinase (ribokinase family)
MMNHDVALYGNLIVDTVQQVSNYKEGVANYGLGSYRALGAIGNVLRALIELDSNMAFKIIGQIGDDSEGIFIQKYFNKLLNIEGIRIDTTQILLAPRGKTSTATVISDIDKRIRTAIINWGSCRRKYMFSPSNTRWNHILYADTLDYLNYEHLQRMNGVISLDLCLSNHSEKIRKRIFQMLPFVDYLIISEVEAKGLTQMEDMLEASKILHRKEAGVVIIHEPTMSMVYNGTKATLMKNDYYSQNASINVLGAGDIFAASFIYDQLSGNKYIESVAFAHKNTSEALMYGNLV